MRRNNAANVLKFSSALQEVRVTLLERLVDLFGVRSKTLATVTQNTRLINGLIQILTCKIKINLNDFYP